MADIKMNAFAPVSDAAYVYVELADGSQGKIKKSDLQSTMFQFRGVFEGDANSLQNSGMYYINGNTINVNRVVGVLVVFSAGRGVVQMSFNIFNGATSNRVLLYNNGGWNLWSEWR